MGKAQPYLNEVDKLERKRINSLAYYYKNRDKAEYKEKSRIRHRASAIKYYNKNKELCKGKVLEWRLKNPVKFKQSQMRWHQKKRNNREVFFIKESSIIKKTII